MGAEIEKQNICQARIEGATIILRPIQLSDVTKTYVDWLNNPEINQYLECRFNPQTIDTVKDFVSTKIGDKDYRMFAIILKQLNKHIGNIKIGPINWYHRRAEIGIIIGDSSEQGKGYATQAIKLLSQYAFEDLNLHKVFAGSYESNKGSIRAFQKAGFGIEHVLKNHNFFNGKFINCVTLTLFNQKQQD